MRNSRVHTEELLADGPYRYVRNPLYLGNILLAAGIGLMASRIGFLILVLGRTAFVRRLLLREEAEPFRDQGEPYWYCTRVPRLLSALTPRVPPAGNAPDWTQALRAELMYWLLALAMLAFAITLKMQIFWRIFAVALALSWVYRRPDTKRGDASRTNRALSCRSESMA